MNRNNQMQKSKKRKSKGKKNKLHDNNNNNNNNLYDNDPYEPSRDIRGRGLIIINKKLTQEILPSIISETSIPNLFYYMDKATAIQYNVEILSNNGQCDIRILNYDFHDKQTGQNVYCIATKIPKDKNRDYEWRMEDKIYTANDLKQQRLDIPKSARNNNLRFKNATKNSKVILDKIINSKHFNILRDTEWHKIRVFDKNNNKLRLTLSLTKLEFINRVKTFIKRNATELKIVPVVMFYGKTFEIEYILMVEIHEESKSYIGIGIKYNDNKDLMFINGLHLDLLKIKQQHQLINPSHKCHCFDQCASNSFITDLIIGNPTELSKAMRNCKEINTMKKTIQKLKNNEKEYCKQSKAQNLRIHDLEDTIQRLKEQISRGQMGQIGGRLTANNNYHNNYPSPSSSTANSTHSSETGVPTIPTGSAPLLNAMNLNATIQQQQHFINNNMLNINNKMVNIQQTTQQQQQQQAIIPQYMLSQPLQQTIQQTIPTTTTLNYPTTYNPLFNNINTINNISNISNINAINNTAANWSLIGGVGVGVAGNNNNITNPASITNMALATNNNQQQIALPTTFNINGTIINNNNVNNVQINNNLNPMNAFANNTNNNNNNSNNGNNNNNNNLL